MQVKPHWDTAQDHAIVAGTTSRLISEYVAEYPGPALKMVWHCATLKWLKEHPALDTCCSFVIFAILLLIVRTCVYR